MKLAGSSALVTGGAVRLGRAMVEALAARGVRVAIHHRGSVEEARALADEVRRRGGDAVLVRADLRDAAAAQRVVAEAAKHWGGLDVLVNSASIFQPGDVRSTDERNWDDHFATNLKAPFFLCQAFARLSHTGRAHVVNIVDWRGTRAVRGYSAYSLTKAALVAMTQNMALELAPTIQVNAIAPGAILPPRGHGEERLAAATKDVPLERHGGPEDVCRALVYLLESDYVTGEVLDVSGGRQL